jgi:phosphoserine phosphatase
VVQAQEMLQLDDATFAPFLRRLKTLQEVRRRYQRGRAQIIQDLQRRLRAGDADEASLQERVETLARHDVEGVAEIRKATDAIDGMLTVRQRARFRVFEHQLELRKLELVGRVRQQIRANRARP